MSLPLVIAPNSSGHIGDHEELHAILANVELADLWVIARFLTGNGRGAAGVAGSMFIETNEGDNGQLYIDNGSGWLKLWQLMPEAIFSLLTQGTPSENFSKWYVPACIVGKTVAQAITTSALSSTTAVTFNDESGGNYHNNEGTDLHDPASQSARFKATRDGFWNVGAYIRWEAGATNDRKVAIQKNNSKTLAQAEQSATTGANHQTLGSVLVELEVGDYCTVEVAQNTGGDLDVHEDSYAWFHFVSNE